MVKGAKSSARKSHGCIGPWLAYHQVGFALLPGQEAPVKRSHWVSQMSGSLFLGHPIPRLVPNRAAQISGLKRPQGHLNIDPKALIAVRFDQVAVRSNPKLDGHENQVPRYNGRAFPRTLSPCRGEVARSKVDGSPTSPAYSQKRRGKSLYTWKLDQNHWMSHWMVPRGHLQVSGLSPPATNSCYDSKGIRQRSEGSTARTNTLIPQVA